MYLSINFRHTFGSFLNQLHQTEIPYYQLSWLILPGLIKVASIFFKLKPDFNRLVL